MLESGTLSKDMAMLFLPPINFLDFILALNGVPGRPVVSCCESLTDRASEIVHHLIKPFLPVVTSYLRDTKYFLSKVRKLDTLPAEAILVSLDVSLYPSIPHEEGFSALSHFLKQQGMLDNALRDIIQMARFVLINNVFEFNSHISSSLWHSHWFPHGPHICYYLHALYGGN
jgi:hypothetical protein